MEATLFIFPSSKPPPSYSQTLSLKTSFTAPNLHRRPPPIVAAISRTKKEQTVETVKHHLQDCHLLAGIKYQGLTVKQFQDLRNSLPETTTLLVAKNTLVFKAIEGTEWEALKPCMKGMNAWMFVHSEEIPAALKPYRSFQKEKKLEENDFSGAVFEGKFYPPEEFQALETMPTRAEIYARLLGAVKGPATTVVATLQAPARDLVLVLKAYVKKLEESGGGQ
ncbi:50S ribosomal protein L10, chloroplastic-like [Actinidia eriantha]|uniref:50S ribosomal protein L10, chloroplastic-like n=1 Tax=Actinidia eriantha TaxID=165200 RepID=UPI0025859071|nr:50S ribosomal protein L10, chloroplastic-like [Actinidia eriantha]